jgi:SAM-dependent methyltransferase
MADTEWRPTPKFLLRRACVRDATAGWQPGFLVEAGAGTGSLTRDFLDRGFHGAVQDVAEGTRTLLRENLAGYGNRIAVIAEIDEVPAESADYLFAFEVLEHIADDAGALAGWSRALRPRGRVLVSVPAHQRKFGSADRLVGHVRRYEKDQLASLLEGTGYEDVRIYNCGFPLGNVTRTGQSVYDRLARRQEMHAATADELRSIDSGVHTDRSVNLVSRLLTSRTLRPAFALQRRYYDSERGDGWVATATKRRQP